MAYERTSEAIKIKSLKIHSEKRLKGLPVAKMCSFSANNIYESLGSGTSDNKVNKESDQAKRWAQEAKQSFIRIATPVPGKAEQKYLLNELNRG